LQLEQFMDVDTFLKDIAAHQDDISEAMRTQTQMCAFYGIKHAGAQKQAARIKLLDKTTRASVAKRVRTELVNAGEKATADLVRDTVDLDGVVKTTALLLIDAEEIETITKMAYFAFRTRTEMLTGLGHLSRAQMQNNQTVQTARQSAESYRARRDASAVRTGTADAPPGA